MSWGNLLSRKNCSQIDQKKLKFRLYLTKIKGQFTKSQNRAGIFLTVKKDSLTVYKEETKVIVMI